METLSTRELILNVVKEKSVLKQDVYSNTKRQFKLLKQKLEILADDISERVKSMDSRIIVKYSEKGEYEAQLKIAGDILIFHMHTNVFKFDNSNPLWKTSYLANEANGYCGVINVYNFLADSFKYHRANDLGYLIGRMFINHENHFMLQGKRQLGFLYNDFINSTIDDKKMMDVLESVVLYTLDFDLFMPPYENVQEVSVYEMTELSNSMLIKTGKRLGFQFQADSDDITM